MSQESRALFLANLTFGLGGGGLRFEVGRYPHDIVLW